MRYLLIITAVIYSLPASAGDAITGRETALKWCASCHDIQGRTTTDKAPGWRTIAEDPSRTPERLRRFLVKPHGDMPPIPLTAHDIDNLLAHIGTLRK